jgi:diacylglycerol kinase (ATP)
MPNDRNMLIVANPTSGRGRGRALAEGTASRLAERGLEVTVRYTSRSGDAQRITVEALDTRRHRPACVVACGGDGTMQEVANALAQARASLGEACPPMGLAPAGRCNDFARALGIARDPVAVAGILADGTPAPIDLGLINDRYFCTVATVGVDAEISSFVDSMRLPLRGTPAYLYGATRVLLRYSPLAFRIEGDFGTIERRLLVASAANTSSYGGAIPIAPHADPSDGALDLCLIDPVSTWRALALVPTVLRGRHGSLAEVQFASTRRFTLDATETVQCWADGERVGHTPANVEISPGAINVMLPGQGSGT